MVFKDLDREIEFEQEMSISEFFGQLGELAFRRMEHIKLKAMLGGREGFVLALGGGTPCYAGNHLLLQTPGVLSVYLQTSVSNLSARLLPEKASRPLIAQIPDKDLAGFIGAHLFERDFYYRHAGHVIDTNGKLVEEIADEIIAQLNLA